LNPWTLSVEALPTTIAYGVEPAGGNDGILRGTIDPNGATEWPESLKSCAALVGLDLPDIDPVASFIHWDLTTFGEHAHPKSDPSAVVTNINGVYSADVPYLTSVESAEVAAGEATSTLVLGEARVQRPGGQTLKDILQKIIDTALGENSTVGALVVTFFGGSLAEVQELIDPTPQTALITITYHVPPPPPPTEAPPETAAPPDPTMGPCIGRDLFSVGGPSSPAGIKLRFDTNKTLTFDFNSSASYTESGSGVPIRIQLSGTISGTWEGTDFTFIVANETVIDLGGIVNVAGQDSELPPEIFNSFGSTSETFTCSPDGQITVDRTGQVYR